MPTLELALFGSFQLRVAGTLVPNPQTKKAQALLAYLAVESQTAHARERLMLLLWPDQPRKQAFDSLRQSLYLLRKIIPAEVIQTNRLDVQFNQSADYAVDVITFSQLNAASQRHAQSHTTPCLACIERLEQAVALYHGDFLQHFVLPDSEAFAEWVMFKREWLQREALNALYQLADHYSQQCHYERARLYAWRQTEIDPPREEAHYQLMQILALSGQRSEALGQYEICRRILADVVAAEPAQATTALYEQVRNGSFPEQPNNKSTQAKISPNSPGESILPPPAPDTPSAAIPHNLPAQLVPLIGRKQECNELQTLLRDPAIRLVTLLGAGGIGKTHLAMRVAVEQRDLFLDGVYWVELAPLSSPTNIVTAIAEAVRLVLTVNDDPRQQLCAYLQPKRLLLLLDNFEHLLAGADLVVALLQAAPDLKIITTSRVRLHLQSEQLFPLDGLDFPNDDEAAPTVIAEYAAVQLFLQQARRTRLHYAPVLADWPAIVQICCLLEGMPLGILLAASWLELYTPSEIAQQIRQNLNFLENDWRDMPERHKSMHAVFDHSWHLLSEREQIIFPQLAIFRGGFTFAAAQCVTQATPRELMGLVDRSLLRYRQGNNSQGNNSQGNNSQGNNSQGNNSQGNNSAGRFELHELVRQFAEEKLKESENDDAAYDRHAAFFTAFLQQQSTDLDQPQQAIALTAIDIEIENIRIAWDWVVQHRQVERLQLSVTGVAKYHRMRRRIKEGKSFLVAASEALEKMISEVSNPEIAWLRLLVELICCQTIYFWMLDDLIGFERLLRRGLTLIEQIQAQGQDLTQRRAFILRELGRLAMRDNSLSAKAFFEQSLALYRSLHDLQSAVHVMNFLGEVAWHMSDLTDAKLWLEQSVKISQQLNEQEPCASALNLLGLIALQEGDLMAAEQHQRMALNITHSLGRDPSQELLLLGDVLVSAGKFAEGKLLFEERISRIKNSGTQGMLAHSYNCLAQAHLHLGEYAQAHHQIQQSLALLRMIDEPNHLGGTRLLQAQLLLSEGAFVEANMILQTNIETLQANRGILGGSLTCSAYPALMANATDQARQTLVEALQTAIESVDYFAILAALPPLALFLLRSEKIERAIELYSLALQHHFIANSRWFADVAGHQIAAVVAQLPAEVAQAAKTKGSAADLWQTARVLLQEIGA